MATLRRVDPNGIAARHRGRLDHGPRTHTEPVVSSLSLLMAMNDMEELVQYLHHMLWQHDYDRGEGHAVLCSHATPILVRQLLHEWHRYGLPTEVVE